MSGLFSGLGTYGVPGRTRAPVDDLGRLDLVGDLDLAEGVHGPGVAEQPDLVIAGLNGEHLRRNQILGLDNPDLDLVAPLLHLVVL